VNNSFNIAIGKLYSPIIAKKIIKEYTLSHDYEEPSQAFPGSIVYMVQSKTENASTLFTTLTLVMIFVVV